MDQLVNPPRVLVLLAAYNGVGLLEEQLDSILRQQGVEVEVLIGVDPSTDATAQLAAELAAEHANVSVINHESAASGAANNFFQLVEAAQPAGHDVVAFADQDDIWAPDKLARAVAELRARGVAAYSSNVWSWYPESGKKVLLDKAQPQRRWDHLFSSAGPGCTYVFDAKAFARYADWQRGQDLSGIDLHDWLLYAWFRQQRLGWYIDPTPTMDYRQHGANQVGANSGLSAARKRIRQIVDGWYSGQILRTAELVGASDAPPIKLLATGRTIDRLRLAKYLPGLRRRPVDRVALLVFSVAETLFGRRRPLPVSPS